MDENGSENNNGNGSSVITASDAKLDDRDWGPVDDDDTIILTMPNRAHDWVKVKKYITEADDAAAAQAAIAKGISFNAQANGNRAARRANGNGKSASSDAEQTQTYHFDTVAQRTVLLQRMIRDWSFKDKRSGAPLPVTAATIGALPVFTRDWIMERLDALNPAADVINEDLPEELDQHGNNTGPLGEPTSVSY